jgi:4-amino-4-deoxy-L-arabinose transferase-like glycosyltransferase
VDRLLLLAAGLRLWSIDFGLDIDRVRPDEEYIVGTAERMLATSDPNPHFFHYPTLLPYLNAMLLRFAPESVAPRLLGRMITAAFGVGTVLLLALLGNRLFSREVGFFAALFLAVAYGHVRESHFATTDVPLLFFVTASVAAGAEARLRGSLAFLRIAAGLAGLAASTKYTGVLALGPLLFLGAGLPGLSTREKLRELLVAGVLFLGAFAATSPFVLLDAEGARSSLSELIGETWGGRRLSSPDPLYPLTFAMRHGLGLGLLSLGLMGLATAGRDFRRALLFLWCGLFYAAAAVTATRFARYSFGVTAPLCLAAADFATRVSGRKSLKLGLALSAAVPPLLDAVAFDRVLGREDTRSLASSWIEDHLPPGTPILVSAGYGAPPIPQGYPFREVRFRLGAVREGERAGFLYLATHDHPALRKYSRIDEALESRLESAKLLVRFTPFREGESPGLFDELDAFYVP